jgi:hypothetical protein
MLKELLKRKFAGIEIFAIIFAGIKFQGIKLELISSGIKPGINLGIKPDLTSKLSAKELSQR